MLYYIILFFVSATGGFIQRVTGFGYGIFVMLFYPHIISPHTAATAVSSMISTVSSSYNAVVYRKNVPYKKILPLAVGSLVMIPIAVRFSTMISGDLFRKLLGVLLILLSIYFLFLGNRIKICANTKNGVLTGSLSGILSGLFSTGGPPVVLYLMNAIEDKNVYFASIQFFFGMTGLYSTVVRALNGIITMNVLVCVAIGFAGCMLGNTIGKRVFDKMNPDVFKKIIYIFMILSGILMMV